MNCGNADQFLDVALALPEWEREEICHRLGRRSAVIRRALRWTRWFVPLFVVGTLLLLGGVFVIGYGGPFWLTAILLPVGVTVVGVPAIKVWHSTWQVLDVAVAATVCGIRSHESMLTT